MPDDTTKEDEVKAQKIEEKKVKKKEKTVFTKVVMRRLPPSMTEDQLILELGNIPEYNYLRYVRGDASLAPDMFCRAYINFLNQDDVIKFRDRFDGLEFTDVNQRTEACVVEYAGFQKIPKKRKEDPKANTIEDDADYTEFLEALQQEEEKTVLDLEVYLEELEKRENSSKGVVETPLIAFIKAKREERRKIREERRRLDMEKRRKRDERKRREIEKRKKFEAERKKKNEDKLSDDNDTCSDKKDDSPKSTNDRPKNKEGKFRDFDKDDRRGGGGRGFKSRKDDWKSDKRTPQRFQGRNNRPGPARDVAGSPPSGGYPKYTTYRGNKWDRDRDQKPPKLQQKTDEEVKTIKQKPKRPDREIYNPSSRPGSGGKGAAAKPQKYSEQRTRVFSKSDT